MAIAKKLLRPIGLIFILLITITTTLFLYAWLDALIPFRHCVGYWIWSGLSAIVFLLFPNAFYMYAVVRYCKKPTVEKAVTTAIVKSSKTLDKKLSRIAISAFIIFILALSMCLFVQMIVVAVYHGTSVPRYDLPVEVSSTSLLSDTVNITRDSNIIPHVVGATAGDVFFGQGFVHAQERFFQLDFFRRIAMGNLSSIMPTDEAFKSDILMRTLGIYRSAFDTYSSNLLSNLTLSALNSYAAGINAYLDANPPTPFEFRHYGYYPSKWNPVDSLAILKLWQWSMSGNFDKELSRLRLLIDRKLNVTRVKEFEPPIGDTSFATFTASELGVSIFNVPLNAARDKASMAAEEVYLHGLQQRLGVTPISGLPTDNDGTSNLDGETMYDYMSKMWDSTAKTYGTLHRSYSHFAVAHEEATKQGQAIFANNIDHRLSIPCFFIPNHLKLSPKVNDITAKRDPISEVMGASLAGVPGVVTGRTLTFFWNMVPNSADTMDFYIVKEVEPGVSYLSGNTTKNYNVRYETITRPGSSPYTMKVLESDYGVIMTKDVITTGFSIGNSRLVLALKWAGLNDYDPSATTISGRIDTTIEIMTNVLKYSSNLEFRQAMLNFWVSPAANFFYSDRDDIKNFFIAGRVPLRQSGHTGMFPVEATPSFAWAGRVPPFSTIRLFKKPIIVSANNRIVGPGFDYNYGYDFDDGLRAQRMSSFLSNIVTTRAVVKDNILELQADLIDTLFTALKPLISMLDDSLLDAGAITAKNALLNWNGDTSDKGTVNAMAFRGFYWELTRLAAKETKIKYWNNPQYILNLFNVNNTRINSDLACENTGSAQPCIAYASKAFQRAISSYGTSGWGSSYHSSPMRHLLTKDGESFACFCSRYIYRGGTSHTVNVAPELMGPSNDFESTHGAAIRFVGYGTTTAFDHKENNDGFFDMMIPMGVTGFQWSKLDYDNNMGRYLSNEYMVVDMKNYTGPVQQLTLPAKAT